MKVHRQLFTGSLLLPASLLFASCAQMGDSSSSDDVQADPSSATITESVAEGAGTANAALVEAPTGYGASNGFLSDTGPEPTVFDVAKDVFEEHDLITDGLGPTYNAQGCIECHQNPVTGAGAQFTELRAGHFNGTNFIDNPGGSLINDRAIDASIQERVALTSEVRTFRIALSLLGDGFVEATDSNTIAAIAAAQPQGQRGTVIQVPLLEAPGNNRVGRFGVKNQHASLESFAADAYVNEIGITSPTQPTENSSAGASVATFDTVADPEDDGGDIRAFTDFMRSLAAPPRGPITAAVTRGQSSFNSIGCNTCHTASINTAPVGTVINGGAFTVPAALGDKTYHPFGDFLLHNIGTGDGIVQNGGQGTRLQVRTMPLWGIRVKSRFMHDGLSLTIPDAINRHAGQAQGARNAFFNNLGAGAQSDVVAFILSL